MHHAAPRRNLSRWSGFIVLGIFIVVALVPTGMLGLISAPFDFRAFYCAGHVALAHADPYLVEPLRSCEISTLTPDVHWIPGLAVPAPLAPYSLPVFSLLGALSFPAATALWAALAFAAWLRMVVLLGRLTGLGTMRSLLATLGLGLLCSLVLGQLTPVTMWLVVEAATALHDGDERRAAFFATFSLIEPQIGGPVWLALFVLRPGARTTLLLGVVVVLAASLVDSPTRLLEWLTQVLPVHANSELHSPYQFSLPSFLALAGTAPPVARALGAIFYAATVALALWAARRLEVRWREAAVIALLPAAFAVLGGPFLHEHHLAAAIPMALLAYARTRRIEFVFALALLSGPWLSVIEHIDAIQVREAFWSPHGVVIAAARPGDFAEVAWASYISAYVPRSSAVIYAALFKLPLWLGVALVCLPLLRSPTPNPSAAKNLGPVPVV